MGVINIGAKNKVEIYDSIENMPFDVLQTYNKYVLLDAELGSTIADFDEKTIDIHKFLSKGMYNEARQGLLNVRVIINNIQNGSNFHGYAFATLIKSIDGEKTGDPTLENLQKVLGKLKKLGLTVKDVYSNVSEVKKKSIKS